MIVRGVRPTGSGESSTVRHVLPLQADIVRQPRREGLDETLVTADDQIFQLKGVKLQIIELSLTGGVLDVEALSGPQGVE